MSNIAQQKQLFISNISDESIKKLAKNIVDINLKCQDYVQYINDDKIHENITSLYNIISQFELFNPLLSEFIQSNNIILLDDIVGIILMQSVIKRKYNTLESIRILNHGIRLLITIKKKFQSLSEQVLFINDLQVVLEKYLIYIYFDCELLEFANIDIIKHYLANTFKLESITNENAIILVKKSIEISRFIHQQSIHTKI